MLFPGAGAALTRRLLAAPARFVFLRFSCPERNAIPKSRAVRPSIKRRLRARVARRQPIFVLALDAALYRLQAKRPARTPTDQSAPRSGLRPKHGGRSRARPQATGRPGPVRVSPVLLPGAECKPQVARCPALHEETASGANCEAATDIRIGVGRRVIQIAGEKARTNAIIPLRAEVRLASQIWGRGHVRPQATGHPGPFCVSPVLLPGAERKSQVAHCPALHEETASGASCEAATDSRIGVGWRLYQVAGEKARTNAIIPISAEVRLAPQIRKGYSVFVFDWLRRHRHKVPPF